MIALVRDQTSTTGAYTVREIEQFWEQRLRGLFAQSNARHQWALAIARYACPPPSEQAFAEAIRMYRQDHPKMAERFSNEEGDAIKEAVSQVIVRECVNLRQSWAVYTRMQDLARKTKGASAQTIACARRQFRGLLESAPGHRTIHAGKFYLDVHALARAWQTLLNCSWAGDWCSDDFWEKLKATTYAKTGEIGDQQTLAVSAALRELDAIVNQRGVGVAQRGGERRAAVAGKTRLSADAPALEAQPTASTRSAAPARDDSPRTAPPQSYETTGLKTGQRQLARSYTQWSARDDADATRPLTQQQLTQLPEATKTSLIRRQHAFSLRGALKNTCDVHRLTASALSWSLNQVEDSAGMVFLILLILGWQPRDAEKLWIARADAETDQTRVPTVTTGTQCLSLPIVGSGQSRTAHRLNLVVSGRLKAAVAKLDEGYPLAGLRDRLNRRWKQQWPAQRSGLRPTCDRVRAAGWLVVRPHCDNDMQAQMFSGRLDFATTVAATYRQVEPGEMQRIWENVLHSLGLGGETSDAMNIYLGMEPVPVLGSRNRLDWPMVRRLNRAISEALDRAERHLKVARERDQHKRINDYIDLVWGQLYLALMLVSAGRPWGETTRSAIIQGQLWLREKSSKVGEESRWLPVPASLVAAIKRLDEWAAQLRRHTSAQPQSPPTDRLALPDRIHFSRGLREPCFDAYSNSAFRRLLAAVMGRQDAVFTAFDEHKNALRHLVATTSQSYLSFAQSNVLLGHHHGFDANTQPESFEPIGEAWAGLARFQNQLLNWLGFQPQTLIPVTDVLRRPMT